MAWFQNFSSGPLPPSRCFALPNARLRRRRHIIHATLPPSPITLDHQFTRHSRNRAIALGFVVFAPQPVSSPCTCERTAPPPPQAYPHCTTTSPHRPAPPFRTAYPKTSCHARFRGFPPLVPLLPRVCKCNSPPHLQLISTVPPPPPIALHPRFARRTQKRAAMLVFVVFGPSPSPALCLQTQRPTTTTTSSAPPHHLPPSLSAAISVGAPKTEPHRLGFQI